MFRSSRRRGLGSIAASGLITDPKLRSAALDAAPPLARLGWRLGRRAAQRRAQERWERVVPALDGAATLLGTLLPQALQQAGLIEPPRRRRRRRVPGILAGAAVAGTAALLLEPSHGAERRARVLGLLRRF
jgi:ferric-dicitrate binding protein FerR (iron transport regulator)